MDIATVLNRRYAVERQLGKGGMGAVYLARHTELDEWLAVKEMVMEEGDPRQLEEAVAQFRVEARILNRLRHRNLPRVWDFFEENGRYYIVMDYIQGETLDGAMRAHGGPVPEGQVLTWARELCDVLDYLHHNDPPVVFRDLKPSNVMRTRDGSLRLIDFGLAQLFDPKRSDPEAQCAVSDGFAAPEQYIEPQPDPRSDIYGLGATLYVLLAYRMPPSAFAMMYERVPAVPIESVVRVSPRTAEAIAQMMALDADQRLPNIQAVIKALGLTPTPPPATVSSGAVRSLLRESFSDFFPARNWLARPALLDKAIKRIETACQREPRPALVAMQAEEGSGKTRLVFELLSREEAPWKAFPLLQCTPALMLQPLGVVRPALQAFLEVVPTGDVQAWTKELTQWERMELIRFLPHLAPEETPQERDPEGIVRDLVAALLKLFSAAAQARSPLLLVVDDAQWCDPATVRLIDLLQDAEIPLCCLLSGTQVTEEMQACLQRRHTKQEEMLGLGIPPLTAEECEAYAKGLLPELEGVDGRGDALLAFCKGNPLRLEEGLRIMVLRRIIAETSPGHLTLQPFPSGSLGLSDMLRRRAEMLPVDTRQLLQLAAATADSFDVELLIELSGQPRSWVTDSLSHALQASMVVPDRVDGKRLRFLCETARLTFYGKLDEEERSRLHYLLGARAEQRSRLRGGDDGSWHLQQSGATGRGMLSVGKPIEVVVSNMPTPKAWTATIELNKELLENAIQTVSMLARGVRSLNQFGSASIVAQTSVGGSISSVLNLLQKIGALNVKADDSGCAINGQPVVPSAFPPDLNEFLSRHKICGFQLRPDLTREHLATFLNMLAGPIQLIQAAGGWTSALAKNGLTEVSVDEKVFVGVAEQDLRALNERSLEARDLLAGAVAVGGGGSPPSAAPAPVPETPPLPPPPEVSSTQTGTDRASLKMLREVLRTASIDDLGRLIRIASALGEPLEEWMASDPEVLIGRLADPDEERRQAASMALLKLGAPAGPGLIRFIASTDSAEGRTLAIYVLRKINPEANAQLVWELQNQPRAEQAHNLLRVVNALGIPWQDRFKNFLFHVDGRVRLTAWQYFLTRGQRSEVKAALQEILDADGTWVVIDAVRVCGDFAMDDMIDPLLLRLKRIAGKSDDDMHMQREICLTLGRLNATRAVPALTQLAQRATGLMMAKVPPPVRAAAAWALVRIDHPQTRDLITKLMSDSDAEVATAARSAR
ncbi:MAG: protein kinase domain-containing protein [Candidatus Xenobia bacterium]